jgi:hypothetical protein
MTLLVVRAPDRRVPERRYVLDVVLAEWLGFEYELVLEARSDTVIRLVGDPQEREVRLADALLSTAEGDWLTQRSMPARPLPRAAAEDFGPAEAGIPGARRPWGALPILFGRPDDEGWARKDTTNGIAFAADILGSVFFLLTRYEEVVLQARDAHDRFPASATVAAAEGFVDRPIVEEYVDWLWEAMLALWPGLRRRETAFRLLPTHDVDHAWATLGRGVTTVARATAGDVVRRHDPALAVGRVRSYLEGRSGRVEHDPFNTFDLLMEASERAGVPSTFYFMAGGDDPRYDGSYRLSDPPVRRLIERIHDRGHDIGLHASYHTYRSPESMSAELDSLREACRAAGFDQASWGVRQHYLRFEAPATWRHQASVGFAHDSSVGFAEVNGFRSGTCREHPVFDLLGRTTLALRERPLVFMDAASDEFLAVDLDGAAARCRALVAECRRHAGDAVVLYHNSSLPAARQRAHYRDLISSLSRGD